MNNDLLFFLVARISSRKLATIKPFIIKDRRIGITKTNSISVPELLDSSRMSALPPQSSDVTIWNIYTAVMRKLSKPTAFQLASDISVPRD